MWLVFAFLKGIYIYIEREREMEEVEEEEWARGNNVEHLRKYNFSRIQMLFVDDSLCSLFQ